jgi:hypothetical protein
MSKPVLIFWMSALGMGAGSAFGLRSPPTRAAVSGVVHPPAHRALAIGALVGALRARSRGPGARAGAARGDGARDHAALVLPRAPGDDRHALRGAAGPRHRDAHARGDRRATGVTPRRVRLLGAHPARLALAPHRRGRAGARWLPQISYLLTRPGDRVVPRRRATLQQCTEMLALNRIGVQFPVETYFYGSAGNSADTLATSVPGSPQWERLASVTPVLPLGAAGLVWLAVLGAGARGPAARAPRAGPLLRALLLVRGLHDGQGARGPRDPRRRRGHALRRLGRVASCATSASGSGCWCSSSWGCPGTSPSRAPGQRVHRPLRGARHHQPHRGRRARRHRVAAVLPVAARLRDVPVVGPRARGGARLAQVVPGDATPEQRDVARIGMVPELLRGSAMMFHHYIFPAFALFMLGDAPRSSLAALRASLHLPARSCRPDQWGSASR